MHAKLMSNNKIDFPSKAHLESKIREIEDQGNLYCKQVTAAGLVSFRLTQV